MTFETVRLFTGIVMPLSLLFALATPAVPLHAQTTNIQATPGAIGTGGLGTSVSTVGHTTNITGGTAHGPNLFHSFNQFSVGSGDVAAFINPGVSNIISRVIGGSPSNINGTVQALNANLFFLNPSGIVFGPSAHLNVSGSAYFSTAQQLRLSDSVFTANTALLALDASLSVGNPVAFGFLGNGPYGSIVLSSSSTLLQTGAVIGLMGGPIQINGSKITAQRIIVGSTNSGGEMSVQPGVQNPFSGASGNGQIQAQPGTLLAAGGGGVIPASVDLLPSNITVLPGNQVITTTNPLTQRVTQVEVIGTNLSAFPPPLTANAAANAVSSSVDLSAFLNRAVMVLPQQAPAAPLPLLTSRCAARKGSEFSSFVQAPRDVTPAQPGTALAAPVVLEEVGVETGAGSPTVQLTGRRIVPAGQVSESWQGC